MNFINDWSLIIKIVIPVITILVAGLIGYIIDRRLKSFRKNLDPESFLGQYSSLIKSFEGSITTLAVVGAIALVLPIMYLPPTFNSLAEKILIVIALGMATLVVSRLAVNTIQLYSIQHETTVSLTSLFEYLTKVIIFSIGFLIIIQSIGIQITALITAFGVGSLSIGLAFQSTLGNLISGVNIIISRKIRPGDYIKLKDGEEGYVLDVELKYTIIRDIYNNVIVIPNGSIVDASFKNYTLEEPWMLIPIKVGVSYDSDLEKVEQVTLNTAKKIIQEMENGITDFEPFLRYESFDYFAITLVVYLKINEYYDRLVVTHQFIKEIHRNYQLEDIKMAFPLSENFLMFKDNQTFK